jgi:hypothetical protein
MSRISLMVGSCLALMLALLVWGCGSSAGQAVPFNATTGAHPTTWLQDHWAEYLQHPDQCRTCHGSTTDPTQAGGISKVSCFGCHASGLVVHPAASVWANPAQHGRLGAELAPVATNDTTVPVMAGFSHCTKCHGSSYDGGVVAVSCMSCHMNAPHPSKPWFDVTGVNPSHAFVNPANTTECAKCHAGGTNSDLKPLTPAPAGTAPGCFNATLCHSIGAHPAATWLQDHWSAFLQNPAQCSSCHGSTTDPTQAGGISRVSCFSCHTSGVLIHPAAAVWAAPGQHGTLGAMLAPVATNDTTVPVMAGFAHCAKCHGSSFDGGLAAVSCMSCHTTAPHPPKPWLADTAAVPVSGHDNTNVANLPVCMGCHQNGAHSDVKPVNPAPAGTPPDCTNGTLCHG